MVTLVVLFISSFLSGYAQTPFIYNYTENELPVSTPFAITQGNDGVMYFDWRDKVLMYDGANFSDVSVRGVVYALEPYKEMILVATSLDFGFLKPLSNGQKKFVSLANQLSEKSKKLPTVWEIFINDEGVFFDTQHGYMLFKEQSDTLALAKEFWVESFSFSNVINNKPCACEETDTSYTLYIIDKGERKNIITTNDERYCDFFLTAPYDENTALMFHMFDGIWKLDLTTKKLTEQHTEASKLMKEAKPYKLLILRDGNIALGTSYKGVIVINKEGDVLYRFDESIGLSSNNISYMFQDRQGNLWASTGSGVSKIAFGLPFIQFNRNNNLRERNHDIIRYKNLLYVATNVGVFAQNGNTFDIVKGTESQCWNLFLYKKHLMVGGGNKGAFYIENKNVLASQGAENSTMYLAVSNRDSSIIYNASYGGLRVYDFSNKKFTTFEVVPGTETDCRSVVELPDGRVWVGARNKGFFRVTFPQGLKSVKAIQAAKVEHFADGLNELNFCNVYKLGDSVVFTSKTGLYRFDSINRKFTPIHLAGIDFKQPRYNLPMLEKDGAGNIWFPSARVILKPSNNNAWIIDSTTLAPLTKTGSQIYQETDSIFWITGDRALYRYDAKKTIVAPPFDTRIGAVLLSANDSLLPLHPTEPLLLDYKHNSLLFQFSATSFYNESGNKFQYLLENYDEHWSEWTSLAQKEYTNLREGTYTFRVRSINPYGQQGNETSYSFVVSPPIYRTMLAYVSYILLGGLMLWLFVRMYTRKLVRDKERLEGIVKERTAEILQQKEEIETIADNLREANTEILQSKEEIQAIADNLREANAEISKQSEVLHKKNDDITASINYARRIQAAMLPFNERFEQAFGKENFFIFYKPRDIVSGDFYWLHTDENKITLAVADCTGHGVPGAFMSMIGNQLLYEIIISNRVTEPSEILTHLNSEVRRVLKQSETGNRDGMDIGICSIDIAQKQIFYAGAMNPLFVVQNNEVETIKGTKMGIGGVELDKGDDFETSRLEVKSNELYLYLASDGYTDQFGGTSNSKFTTKRFREMLLNVHILPMNVQKSVMEQTMKDWLKHTRQIDDITVVGIKLVFEG